jgi:uncharacterized integral membrane protein
VESAILKSLEKKPEKRFSSAHHFLQSLPETMPYLQKEFTEKGPIFSLPEWLTLRGKWPIRPSAWKNMFPFAPLDSWVARYQRLPAKAKWMILLAGTLLIILFLVILFSISTRSLV